MNLFKLDAMGQVYADSFVGTESNELLFISLYGGQTEIRRLQSAITIGDKPEQGGLASISGGNGVTKFNLRISNPNHLGQTSGVIQKTLFGDLVHLWVFNEHLLKNLDYSNGIGYFLIQDAEHPRELENQIWSRIKVLAEIPLLDEWQNLIMFHGQRFYRALNVTDPNSEYPCIGVKVDLSDGFTDFVAELLKSGDLPINVQSNAQKRAS